MPANVELIMGGSYKQVFVDNEFDEEQVGGREHRRRG